MQGIGDPYSACGAVGPHIDRLKLMLIRSSALALGRTLCFSQLGKSTNMPSRTGISTTYSLSLLIWVKGGFSITSAITEWNMRPEQPGGVLA